MFRLHRSAREHFIIEFNRLPSNRLGVDVMFAVGLRSSCQCGQASTVSILIVIT